MNLIAFQTLRDGLRRNAAPATTQVRTVLEVGLREELLATGLFEEVEVGGSDDAERLVLVLGTIRADAGEDLVAAAVRRVWSGLAFHYWEAHAFLTDRGHVELQAATLDRPGGRYVTVHLVAQHADAVDTVVTAMPRQLHAEAPVLAQSA